MSDEKEFTLDKIKDKHIFLKNSEFYKIYNEFNKECTEYRTDNKDSCYKKTSELMNDSSDVNNLLKELYSHLYRIYVTIPVLNNTYFDGVELNDEKLGCLCLKYWLYDKIITKNLKQGQIIELFDGWEKHIEKEISYNNLKPCKFYNLKKDEINNIKKIYAFYAIFYGNISNAERCSGDNCKYMYYFGEGLDEFINSINSCSENLPTENYCNEFNEFIDICKNKNLDSGISIYHENKEHNADGSNKYLLSVEKYKDQLLYIYIKNEKLLNFVKTSHFLSNKSTTIAATSAVGSAIGLSSIFYYFYKFTPFGSTLRKGKKQNIVNIDEQHNDSLYTADIDQTQFKNRKYNVAYHTFSDT
ncbi:unnamed protein product [Plasmodium vivax]|uniref:(malaria parasite P. vivax) hypothetical protein n=1 Tax=Plasmodium vivax TaxID=5855 RepID=Q7K6M7_PLAVI|nr:vir21 [Plasmodium vivax]CAG9483805.1 unnamed protein product [Plasmodium vivax]